MPPTAPHQDDKSKRCRSDQAQTCRLSPPAPLHTLADPSAMARNQATLPHRLGIRMHLVSSSLGSCVSLSMQLAPTFGFLLHSALLMPLAAPGIHALSRLISAFLFGETTRTVSALSSTISWCKATSRARLLQLQHSQARGIHRPPVADSKTAFLP